MSLFSNASPIAPAQNDIWMSLLDRGLTIAVLAAAVYIVGRMLIKVLGEKDRLYEKRIEVLEETVKLLKEHVDECNEAREEMSKKIEEIRKGQKS